MVEMIKTAVFSGVRQVAIEEFPIPALPADRVLMKIEACAICTWEQRVYTGVKKVEFPFVGGHEMVGTILEIGDEVDQNHWKIGVRAVVGVTLPCRSCYPCRTGNEQNCEHFNHTQPIVGLPYKGMGGLSSHLIAHPSNLFKVENISSEEACIVEPLSCVIHSVDTAALQFGETAVVIGCGIMGLLHVMLAAKRGACVIASDVNEERLALAQKMGARFVINPVKEVLQDKVREYTGGVMAQVVFDTTPISQVAEDAVKCISNNGRLILYSSFYPDTPMSISPDWLHKSGAKLMGTANSNTADFMKASRMLSQGIIDVKDLISEVYDFEEIVAAFESSAKADKFRVIVKF